MKIGPKYKLARRLGAPIFEKTQTQKYALSQARKEKSAKRTHKRARSEFGTQLIEKQKARLSYGLTERQFRIYVDKSLTAPDPTQKLFSLLEKRLDNALYRAGFTRTRAQARQAAGHGHTLVNGRRVDIPSIALKAGDVVGLRPRSAESPLFASVAERMNEQTIPAWLEVDPKTREMKVVGEPVYDASNQVFDLRSVIEFYNR